MAGRARQLDGAVDMFQGVSITKATSAINAVCKASTGSSSAAAPINTGDLSQWVKLAPVG
jgi:hypothetical protein